MGSVWKRLQRVNKRAAKFQFTSSYHELHVETTAKWRPSNLSVVWTRRSRRVASTPLPWEPDMMSPLVGHIAWPVPDNHSISVTLFKDPRTHELEDKDWTFVIEDITPMGKKRVLASTSINMRKYASIESTQQSFTLKLKPISRKITSADLELTISCVLLREGKATDEDMQSVVSMMSVNNNCDVAPLDDLEDIPDLESTGDISDHLFDFTQQLEQLTSSLNGCNDLPTPLSVPSLSEDPTPLAEVNSFKFEPELDKQGPQMVAVMLLATDVNDGDDDDEEESLKTPSAMRTMLEPTELKSRPKQSMTLAASEKEKCIVTPITKFSMTPTTPPATSSSSSSSSELKLSTAKSKMYTSTPLASKITTTTTTTTMTMTMATPTSTSTSITIDGGNSIMSKARRGIDFNQDSTLQSNDGISTTTITTVDDGDMMVQKEKNNSKTNDGATAAASKDNTTTTRGQTGQRIMNATNVGPQALITKTTPKLTTPSTSTTTLTSVVRVENGGDGGGGIGGVGSSSSPDRRKPTLLQRSDQKRAELLPLNLKKSYDHDSSSSSSSSGGGGGGGNNQNNDAATTMTKPVEKIILKENTPGQDLLEWCKDVTREYPNVKVTNLTTSWRNGMAFCAIIHHFEPHLVDMEKLSSHDVVGNCRAAFDAAETLGIPRVIEPRDMSLLAVPDKLAVMTYLHQLRAHFTGKQLQIEQIGPTSDESSYVIGNYKSDNLSQNLLNLSHLKTHLLHQNSLDDDIYGIDRDRTTVTTAPLSPSTKKDVKNLILAGSKSILGKVLSPAKDKNAINVTQHAILPSSISQQHSIVDQNKVVVVATAAAVVDQKKVNSSGGGGGGGGEHFVDAKSDIDGVEMSTIITDMGDEQTANHHHQQQQQRPTSPNSLEPMAANKILSRHKEMSERAKMMMEKLKISNGERNETDEERQQRLREQARRLIFETRTKATNGGSHHNLDSPTSPTKLKRMNFSPERTISPIQNGIDNIGSHSPTKMAPTKKITPPRDGDMKTTTMMTTSLNNSKQSPSHRLSERFNNSNNSPLQSFNSVMERISPKNDKKVDKMSYIESELEALEREQEAIDQKASSLEKKLRAVMGGNPKTEETEEQLLSQWFTLVNKKNALLRRQMQLNILEQESDLERRYTMLNKELRAAQSVEDWRKTEAQREKERLLLEELVAIVDKRDQLVQRLHNQEIAIEDDHEIARELEQVDISGGREKCSIQ